MFNKKLKLKCSNWQYNLCKNLRENLVITTAQLPSTKPELRFCSVSNPARGVSEICDGENLWEWPWLEIRLNAFRLSTIPQKQSIVIISITFPFLPFFGIYFISFIFPYHFSATPSNLFLSSYQSFSRLLHTTSALQINIIPLPVTMNRKIKKPPAKLNFRRSQ